MITAMHAALYLLPGLAFFTVAESMRRFGNAAISASRGYDPPWARKVVWLSVGLSGAAGVALLAFGSFMASIILRSAL